VKTLQMPVSSTANRESLPLLSSQATRINRRLSSLWYKNREHSDHSFVAKLELPSRNSARTEERESRCLRIPCRSRPYNGGSAIRFLGSVYATTQLHCCYSSSSRRSLGVAGHRLLLPGDWFVIFTFVSTLWRSRKDKVLEI